MGGEEKFQVIFLIRGVVIRLLWTFTSKKVAIFKEERMFVQRAEGGGVQ